MMAYTTQVNQPIRKIKKEQQRLTKQVDYTMTVANRNADIQVKVDLIVSTFCIKYWNRFGLLR